MAAAMPGSGLAPRQPVGAQRHVPAQIGLPEDAGTRLRCHPGRCRGSVKRAQNIAAGSVPVGVARGGGNIERRLCTRLYAFKRDFRELKGADARLRREIELVEGIGRGVGEGKGFGLFAVLKRCLVATVQNRPRRAVQRSRKRPFLRIVHRHIVGAGDGVAGNRDGVREFDLPGHRRGRAVDAPLGAGVAVNGRLESLGAPRLVRTPGCTHNGRRSLLAQSYNNISEVSVGAEARDARVVRTVGLARECVVIVVDAAPEALLVEPDAGPT